MSNFYSLFAKKTRMAIQAVQIPMDYISDILCETIVPECGDLISRVYVKGLTLDNLVKFEIVLNDEIIQSFSGEYIRIKQFLETPKQKSNLLSQSGYIVIPCKRYLPVFKFLKFRIQTSTKTSPSILIDYVFLESPPKNTDMLIEQVRIVNSDQLRIELNLKHPTKELYIVVRDPSQPISNLLTLTGNTQLTNIKLDINDNTKFDLPAMYFSKIQPMDYHVRIPVAPYIFYTYSFALDPQSEFPTGTINMGRIKHQVLTLTASDNAPKRVTIYATYYNVIAPDGILYFT
jgi:hypothetical protein